MAYYSVFAPLGTNVKFYTCDNKELHGVVDSITISIYMNEYKIRVGKRFYKVQENELKII